jgi:hypothetical protein
VESYHGKIHFESEYGFGTKFVVKLPIFKNWTNKKPKFRINLGFLLTFTI